jgi:beta-lactamase superfamily II metal-dependent hydrolase
VAHHGSYNGTDAGFVHAAAPRYAVISSGNRYGHPHREALQQYQVRMLRTDQVGDVKFRTDGVGLRRAKEKVATLFARSVVRTPEAARRRNSRRRR